jgi:hypothetical protein
MKGVLPWPCRAGTKDFYPALAALVSPVPVLWICDIVVRIRYRYHLKGHASTCEASPDLLQPYSEPPTQQPEPKRISTNQCKNVYV